MVDGSKNGDGDMMDLNQAISNGLVRWIKSKKLETPATLFLEMHRPLMSLAWPAATLCGGFIAPFFGPDYYDKIEGLRDPKALDRILDDLAAGSREDGSADKDPK